MFKKSLGGSSKRSSRCATADPAAHGWLEPKTITTEIMGRRILGNKNEKSCEKPVYFKGTDIRQE